MVRPETDPWTSKSRHCVKYCLEKPNLAAALPTGKPHWCTEHHPYRLILAAPLLPTRCNSTKCHYYYR